MNSQANIEKKRAKIVQNVVPIKKQANSHLKLQPAFLQKHVCALWTNTVMSSFLVRCCIRRVNSALYRLFSSHTLSVSHMGQHCTSPCAALAQIDPDKIVDYFLMQSCLWTVGQHCTGNFLHNVNSGRSRQHCSIGYLPAKRWLCTLG